MACSCRPVSPSRCCSAEWSYTPPTVLPQRPDFLPERDGPNHPAQAAPRSGAACRRTACGSDTSRPAPASSIVPCRECVRCSSISFPNPSRSPNSCTRMSLPSAVTREPWKSTLRDPLKLSWKAVAAFCSSGAQERGRGLFLFTGLYLVSIPGPQGRSRFRVPAVPFLALSSGYGVAVVVGRRREGGRPAQPPPAISWVHF